MLSKKSRPMIEVLNGSFLSGNKSGPVDFATSPRTHSPNGPRKSFEISGVGLGIVAALDNPVDGRGDFPAAVSSRNSTRSNPIPVKSPCRNMERDSLEEEHTIVSRHFPNKAYGRGGDRCHFRIQTSLFKISPEAAGPELPEADFLSSCHLCRKNLHGEDIYMYRGEKAFCSTECRYREMAIDERREKCGSAMDLSSAAPRANGSILAI